QRQPYQGGGHHPGQGQHQGGQDRGHGQQAHGAQGQNQAQGQGQGGQPPPQGAQGQGAQSPQQRRPSPTSATVVRMIDRDKLLERVPGRRLGGGGGGGNAAGQRYGQVTELKVVTDPFGRGREM